MLKKHLESKRFFLTFSFLAFICLIILADVIYFEIPKSIYDFIFKLFIPVVGFVGFDTFRKPDKKK